MTLNQLLVIIISLYNVRYEHLICARIPDISPDIRYPIWKTLIRYNPDIRYLEPWLKHMASIILKHSRQLPEWILSEFCSPLLTCHGPCSNWMSKMLLIWGSLGGSLYGATPRLCCSGGQKSVISRRPYMDSSRVQGRDLRSSLLPFLLLDFTGVIQITLYSFSAQSVAS